MNESKLNKRDTNPPIEKLQFHWDVWKDESKAFWGRAILGTALLLTSIMFQFGVIRIKIPGIELELPPDPWWFYFSINVLSWLLWFFLGFKFVDLLRHRVPERIESDIHNNLLPNPFYELMRIPPKQLPLMEIGRGLYLIFPFYAAALAVALCLASAHVLTADLSKQKDPPKKVESLSPSSLVSGPGEKKGQ